ncbi:MAG: hypothetical protein A3F73_05895 [Gallionellales bacterium RIFCSPLOWO2_12_FULL_59_22]|nr:MAG: hypothetical protein A3H99_06320 [Gallionellales bacterium RIFCSPLOWO2_02_FULL_59_110]OGT02992.1 MAG: hypothetical protein A2Z65_00060 [Gallionellales bacterium RIFCSPLOWO2_02_58_13]OGT11681.1 MAG: hypothetical protein A3F73_05895 [Gallionellales bacterium RIFCSPLOWO2_12_FULL_59_22]
MNRALISYATARALNAAISVAQGTEVAVEPGGVGVNFAPGQALDPINDLVEQFSSLMLVACVAFGVQKILISIGGYWLVSLVLTAAALGWAWFYFRDQKPPVLLTRILVILLMIRFAIPMVTLGTDLLFQKFMDTDYKASQQVIDLASGQVTEISQQDPISTADQGLVDKIKERVSGLWAQTKAAVDVKAHYMKLKQMAEQWAVHIINLIVIFLLQTLIIPVLLIWLLYAVARGTFEVPVKRLGATAK